MQSTLTNSGISTGGSMTQREIAALRAKSFESPAIRKARIAKAEWPDIEVYRTGLIQYLEGTRKDPSKPIDMERVNRGVAWELQRREQLTQSTKEFESIFLNMLMKSMQDTVKKNEMFHGGKAEEMFQGMLRTEQTKQWAKDGPAGIGNMLEQHFIRALERVEPNYASDLAKAQHMPYGLVEAQIQALTQKTNLENSFKNGTNKEAVENDSEAPADDDFFSGEELQERRKRRDDLTHQVGENIRKMQQRQAYATGALAGR